MHYELYVDAKGNHRWRLKSGERQILALAGEGFASKPRARAAATSFKSRASSWSYVVYEDLVGKYRWRVRESDGKRIACSGEPFTSRPKAERAAEHVRVVAATATGP